MSQITSGIPLRLALVAASAIALAMPHLSSIALGERRIRGNRTVAHECLERELHATGHASVHARQGFALLDAIIKDVAGRLPARINSADPSDARHCLQVVETVLAGRRFYVAIPTPTLMDTLTASPAPRNLKPLTPARREAMSRSTAVSCHRMDCDTGSIIYAAIGEALDLPLVIVEAPGHKFVRWQLTGRQYINWDPNAAQEYSNDAFRRGRTLTYKTRITRTEEAEGKYFTPLSRRDVLAYHCNIVAGIMEKRGRVSAAASEYQKALNKRPHDSLAANNLAWLYLDTSTLRTAKNVRKALTLAKRATTILPRNRAYQDTLARAYAANGNFSAAIAAEQRGFNDRERISLFLQRQTY